MKKIFIIFLTILLVTACNKNIRPIIKMDECKVEEVMTCYYSEHGGTCFDYNLCLYVDMNKEKITIEKALEDELITLNDVKIAYSYYQNKLNKK